MSGVEVIAEIGVNHNNQMDRVVALVAAAREAGADTVKFQHSTVDEMTSRLAAPDHYDYIKSIVPSREFIAACKEVAGQYGVGFLCTPDGEESFSDLLEMGIHRVKIGSDNLLNFRLLREVAMSGLQDVIISTGLHRMSDIFDALRLFAGEGGDVANVSLLHCTSLYPCPITQASIQSIAMLREKLPMLAKVGWSDHTRSMTLPAAAVALGATIIEKHIGLAGGPDAEVSLSGLEFRVMVASIREAERAYGVSRQSVSMKEDDAYRTIGKSIVAYRDIAAGEVFSEIDNLTVKRPGTGLHPRHLGLIKGKQAHRAYRRDELIDTSEI